MLSETIDFEGIRLGLVDTAGIGVSSDDVEQEGVWRARRAAEIADLVVLVIDRSRPLEEIDLALLEETAGAARVVAVNKSDLAPAWNIDDEDGPFRRGSGVLSSQQRTTEGGKPTSPVVLSLKTGAGVDELRAAMREALHMAEPLREAAMVTNVRHEALLRQVRDALWRAIENLAEAGEWASEELVLADLGDARRAFEEVTGRRTTEDVLARIFERFCVGK
jgi:tRNA modification GTPase